MNDFVEDTLEAAQVDHLAGRLDEAAARCEEILATDPSHARGHHVLALVRMGQQRLGEALDHVQTAVSAEPENGAFLNSLGLILMAQGALDEAVAAFRRSLAAAPHYPQAQVNLGQALRRLGRFDEARAVLDRTIAAKPNFAPAYFAVADIHRDRGNKGATAFWAASGRFVRREYEKALDLYWTAGKLGRADKAVDILRRALAGRPGDRTTLETLAIVLTGANRLEEALTCLDRLATGRDRIRTHIDRARALLALGRFTEGWAEFEWRLRDRRISRRPSQAGFSKGGLGRAPADSASDCSFKPNRAWATSSSSPVTCRW